MLVFKAFLAILVGRYDVCKLLLVDELFEGYLLDWAVHSGMWTVRTNARWGVFQLLERYCFFVAHIVVSGSELASSGLNVFGASVPGHKVVDVNVDVCEVLLSLPEHLQGMLFLQCLLRRVFGQIVFLLISAIVERTLLFLNLLKLYHTLKSNLLMVAWRALAQPACYHVYLIELSNRFLIVEILHLE